MQFVTGWSRDWGEVEEAAVTLPGVSLKLQQLQLACGGKEVWQQSGKLVALKIEVGEVGGVLKEASTKPGETVEGKIETFQGGQVLQLVALQPREKVAAEDTGLGFYVRRSSHVSFLVGGFKTLT